MWALAFLRSFCQLKYPAIASSDFVTTVFSRVGVSAPLLKMKLVYIVNVCEYKNLAINQ
jgi:hypothetical protein